MAKNKFLDLSGVSYFLNKCKSLFAPIFHSHNLDEITDYVVDTELSSTSSNPVENKAVQSAIQTLEDKKANQNDFDEEINNRESGDVQTLSDAMLYTDNLKNGQVLENTEEINNIKTKIDNIECLSINDEFIQSLFVN